MTKQEALLMVEQIKKETKHVETAIEQMHKGKSGFRVVAILLAKQLRHTLIAKDEWQSIKEAWQWWLPDVEEEVEEKRSGHAWHQQYLVDGIPMRIKQEKTGYWRARYRDESGKERTKYFGKVDPRGRYPIYQQEEAV